MKILFTGASSFSGMWFVKQLAVAGHEVTAIFRQNSLAEYTGIRRQRIDRLLNFCSPIFGVSFGDKHFLSVIGSGNKWDLLCHHAADVTNYKSPDFNVVSALANNTNNIKAVLQELKNCGCHRVLLTGSVFEQSEGAGSDGLRAVSPYGLSKGFSADTFAFYTNILEMKLGKFVIPNPFGPYEDGRFTTYLIQNWFNGNVPSINTPQYIRDNIPISLLAKAYVQFAMQLSPDPGYEKFNPSCYVESQGSFTKRFSMEMQSRLNIPCPFELKNQQDFNEPMKRFNTDMLDWRTLNWNENEFWKELATYYQATLGKQ